MCTRLLLFCLLFVMVGSALATGNGSQTSSSERAEAFLALVQQPVIQALADGSMPQPSYPESALREGHSGLVLLKVQLDSSGLVQQIELVQSAHEDLDQAAMDYVRNSKWSPGLSESGPVNCEFIVPVRFVLKDHGSGV